MFERPKEQCHSGLGRRCRGFRRMTLPRQIILETLEASTEPLSAEDIYLKVHQVYPQIGLATVYRTLDILLQEGEVARLEVGDRKARYAIIQPTTVRNYFYLVCTRCGRIEEVRDLTPPEQDLLQRAMAMLAEKYQFQVKVNYIQLRGLCQQCQKL